MDIQNLKMIGMGQNEKETAIEFPTEMVHPSPNILQSCKHFKETINILEWSLVVFVFDIGFLNERIFRFSETAGNDLY